MSNAWVYIYIYVLALQIDPWSLESLDPGFLSKNYAKRIEGLKNIYKKF